jgi:hypothetical protein
VFYTIWDLQLGDNRKRWWFVRKYNKKEMVCKLNNRKKKGIHNDNNE